MIYYICRNRHSKTITRFLNHVPRQERPEIRLLTYEQLFRQLSLRPSHIIFTDMDRLSQYELEIAAATAEAVKAQAPDARILNHPAHFLQRFEFLDRLSREGNNPFRAARLELALPELRFPVFLRRESDAGGPETMLLWDKEELHQAIKSLSDRGIPLRGRIAVEYCAVPDSDGMFRKYGAFRIGNAILPQHIQFSEDWVVKGNSRRVSEQNVEMEMDYIRTNPHQSELIRLSNLAKAEFGRIDYTMRDGQIVVYEFNSNPTFPQADKDDLRQARRLLTRQRIVDAFKALDTPIAHQERLYIERPRPRSHDLPGPGFLDELRKLGNPTYRERQAAKLWALFRKS